jgi:hypothetical protein
VNRFCYTACVVPRCLPGRSCAPCKSPCSFFGPQCPKYSPSVSQDMSQLSACWTVSSVVYLRCTCLSCSSDCQQLRKFCWRPTPFGLVFVCHESDTVLQRMLAVWEFRLPCMMKRIGWFVQTTFPPFCLHSPNRVTHANPAISRVPAPVGRTSQHIYLL